MNLKIPKKIPENDIPEKTQKIAKNRIKVQKRYKHQEILRRIKLNRKGSYKGFERESHPRRECEWLNHRSLSAMTMINLKDLWYL